MTGKLRVSSSDLRASAHAQDSITDRIKGPIDKSIADTKAAATSMGGWSISTGLQDITDSWERALKGLHSRLEAGSSNLSASAKTHQWNEQRVQGDFEGFTSGSEGVIASAPASSPAGISTMPAPVDPGGAFGNPPSPDRARGLDDFQDAQPAMPTYPSAVENVAPEPGTTLSTEDMINAKPAPGSTYTPDEIRGGPAPHEGPSPDRLSDFG